MFAHGSYVNRNHFAGLLVPVLPFAAAGPLAFLRKRSTAEEMSAADAVQIAGMSILSAISVVGIIFSQSRMGLLAALCSLSVVGVLALATRAHALPSRRTVSLYRERRCRRNARLRLLTD